MIISVINNKGGVLKTTIATNLAAALSLLKKKVLVIDLDGQGNVCATFGKNPDSLEYSIIDILKTQNDGFQKISFEDVMIPQREPYLHILPSNDEMNAFDFYISNGTFKPSDIQKIIRDSEKDYDFVIMDTPPNMSTVVLNAISISDLTIIPFEPDQYAILGLKRVAKLCIAKSQQIEKKIKLIAIPTKVNKNTNIHREIIEVGIKPFLKNHGIYLTNTYISQSTKSTASVGYERLPIVLSIVKSKFQEEYFTLRDEILEYIEREKI